MNADQILTEIREANLSYLMLAQSLIRADREQALYRLGVSEDSAAMISRPSVSNNPRRNEQIPRSWRPPAAALIIIWGPAGSGVKSAAQSERCDDDGGRPPRCADGRITWPPSRRRRTAGSYIRTLFQACASQ